MLVYAYKGDLKKLKTLAYKFDKVSSSNNKMYSKNKIFMFVIEKMCIEISNLNFEYQKNLIDFIIKHKDEPQEFWERRSNSSLPILKNAIFNNYEMTQYGNIMEHHEFIKKKKDIFCPLLKDFDEKEASGNLSDKEIDILFDDVYNNEFAKDNFRIKYSIVKDILDLHKLHPLELIELEEL